MRRKNWKLATGSLVLGTTLGLAGWLWAIGGAAAQNPATPAESKAATAQATITKSAANEAGANRSAAPEAKAATSQRAAAPAKKVAKKPAGRLPIYYADIVTDAQRLEIYAIQAGYAVKLRALTEQVKAIQAQQNTEIEALLTAEQKEKLYQTKEAAAAKRKQRAAASTEKNATVSSEKQATAATVRKTEK
jgi:hypothetical protein